MENQFDNTLTNQTEGNSQRPGFLKVLCILSFVMCGLSLLIFTFGAAICLSMSSEAISEVWDKIVASQPSVEGMDPMEFFNAAGKLCLYYLIANVTSLLGVIMMWRLNKIGFFIYVVAELVPNFFSLGIEIPNQEKSYGSLAMNLIFDIAFIVMFALNLKHMKK